MVQLITFLLVVAALVILVLQNLSPVLGLVVLGNSTVELPLSVWLLSAIALGALCALIIYQLVPQKRSYRPMGQRLTDPAPGPESPNRFVDSPSDSVSGRPSSQPPRHNPYDSDWEDFRAPEQWDDWGKQQTAGYAAQDIPGTPAEETIRDIESGWGDDGYNASARVPPRTDSAPDIGWDAGDAERPSSNYSPRTYEEGWLYGNDSTAEPPDAAEPESPAPEESEDVYDANYRVIIPPYDSKESKDS